MAQNKLNTYFSHTYIDVETEIQYSKYLSDLPWELKNGQILRQVAV